MNKALGWTLGILLLLAGAAFGGRMYATRAMYARAVTPKPLGAVTPASDSLPFSRLTIPSGGRTLVGWWVRADADSGTLAPAVLFLHGNRSAISDYVPLLRFFHRQGISAMVFDYSGFGASGGSPSLATAVEDAGNAARVFADSAGLSRRVAFGSALGATVLLQAVDSVQPHVNGLIIEGVTASVRESAVRDGRIPKLIAPLVPDIADNVAAARRVSVPMLAVHSFADTRFPFSDAERVVEGVPAKAALVRHWRRGHSSLLTSSRPCDWAPVIAFVREGTLPPAKVDTVDACAEAARLAAERVRADSIRQDSVARAAQAAQASKAAPTKTKAPAPRRRSSAPARRP